MSDPKNNKGPEILAQLNQLEPPTWISEMRKHYAQHGTFRPEDIARLLGDRSRSIGALAQTPASTTAQLLQQMATRKPSSD